MNRADLLMHEGLRDVGQILATASFDRRSSARGSNGLAHMRSELCRRAVGRLFAGSGAHAVYDGHPLQAAFRNINVGAQHASFDFDSSAEQYGRVLLGVGTKRS